jgi:predicted SAM-dependent methyltransferase
MKKIKLHLGCGDRYLPGYTHVDIDEKPHIDYPNTDVDDLSSFADNSVDLIYNCGMFEYFDRETAPAVLKEWKRVLKPKGILRVSVPNFQSIVEVYLTNGLDLNGEGILGPLFGRWETSNGKVIYHKTVYDFKSLSEILSSSGFTDIKKYDTWEVTPENYDDYSKAYIPYKDKNGIQMHLNVECRNG